MTDIDVSTIKKILVIRYRSIGDILLSNPALVALRQKFPGATIDYLVDDSFASVVEGNRNIDRIITHRRNVTKKKLSYELSFAAAIRKQRYDMVIDLQSGPRGAWLTRLSGARHRVGHPFRLRNKIAYNIHGEAPAPNEHAWQVQFRTIRPLGIDFPAEPEFFLKVTKEAETSVTKRLRRAGLDITKPFVLIHPGARIFEKRWPTEKMGAIARWLHGEKEIPVAVVGAGADRDELEKIKTAAGYHIPVSSNLTIPELVALISHATLLLCNDSGPMHMAATLGKPVVALFGPSDPLIWGPLAPVSIILTPAPMPCMPCDQKSCPLTGEHCMTRIDVDSVKTNIERTGLL